MFKTELFSEVLMNKSTTVKTSHELNHFRGGYTRMELDFIYAFISQIQDDDKKFKDYKLTLSELEEKLNKRLQLRDIEYLFDSLIKKTFKVHNEKTLVVYTFFSSIQFNKETKELEVSFNEKLKPHLLQLKTYARGNFRYILQYKSEYTKRLYMLMSQWKRATKCTYSVEELREMLEVPESYKWSDIRKHILDKSETEMKKSGDLFFEYEVLKQGRKITDIFFRIYVSGGKDKTKKEVTYEHFKGKTIYFQNEDRLILNVWQSKEHKDYLLVQLQAIDKSTITPELHRTVLENSIAHYDATHPKLI